MTPLLLRLGAYQTFLTSTGRHPSCLLSLRDALGSDEPRASRFCRALSEALVAAAEAPRPKRSVAVELEEDAVSQGTSGSIRARGAPPGTIFAEFLLYSELEPTKEVRRSYCKPRPASLGAWLAAMRHVPLPAPSRVGGCAGCSSAPSQPKNCERNQAFVNS